MTTVYFFIAVKTMSLKKVYCFAAKIIKSELDTFFKKVLKDQGIDSQKFLSRFLKLFVTLGLKILSFYKKCFFEADITKY